MKSQEEIDKIVQEVKDIYKEYEVKMDKLKEEALQIIGDVKKKLKEKKLEEVMDKISHINI